MPEVQVKLRGWQVAVAAVVLAGVVAVRLVTFSDKKDDRALVQNIEMQLMSEYYPDEAARLRAAYESGDVEATQKVLDSAVSTMCNIDSIRASYPLFDFSTPKDVVVKVTYSLIDSSGPRATETVYYLYSHGAIGNIWSYQYKTTSVSYYLNFL